MKTNVLSPVLSTTNEDGQIHLIPIAISIHFDGKSTCTMVKTTFIHSNTNCLFHAHFGIQPQTTMPYQIMTILPPQCTRAYCLP